MYRLTTRGIFFSFSSFIAICKGSVWPSRSTNTGAFILQSKCVRHKCASKYDDYPFSYLICSARVPRSRALSYFVMYGVVDRLSLGILFLSSSPAPRPAWFAVAAATSPDATKSWPPPCVLIPLPFASASSPSPSSSWPFA